MGSSSSKSKPVAPVPISTTVTVHTTVQTSTAALPDSEGESLFDNPDISYFALAFISGILSTLLVVAVVCLIRKRYKRSQENLQEQIPSKAQREEPAENIQNEVFYASVVIKPQPKAAPV
ncbi:transmembrane protein C1orf162 homolog [Lagopus muta]|uniref:transmembrane protein C1orf162 homolog n=1 Tax=Lagopus muta TaxID=64668 RepID=UPI0020A13917|nr:transmembrane protein C1orf162 homolog [Lagopus muta]